MTQEQFDKVLAKRIEEIQNVLLVKRKEYARNDNPLHNFDIAARVAGTSREKALWGFALKHYISLMDIFDDIERGSLPKEEVVEEKIGDLINYLILAEASIKDRLKK